MVRQEALIDLHNAHSKHIFWTVADILQHVPSKVPDIDCGRDFMELYLGKIPIISMYMLFFLAVISCS